MEEHVNGELKQKAFSSVDNIKCFWTWPWGHIWGPHPLFSGRRLCAICDQELLLGTQGQFYRFDIVRAEPDDNLVGVPAKQWKRMNKKSDNALARKLQKLN
ncbi:hypothetical protein ACFLY5_00195 [Patescibacteria group bacterium]